MEKSVSKHKNIFKYFNNKLKLLFTNSKFAVKKTIRKINALELFKYNHVNYTPNYALKINSINNCGVREVYDISVAKLESFIANGVIVHNCTEVFLNREFKHKLDANPHLICFKNGVYDLDKGIFRAGIPEDYISKSMPIDYIEYNEYDDEVIEVHTYLEKVFPDPNVRQYFIDNASDVFLGGNSQKLVLFWTGEGDNGKSVTQSIFEKMLGELAIKFSTTLITGKKTQIGSANPELARAGCGVRWAVLEEPDNDEQINVGTLKSLSGNDSYWARDLFEKGKDTREITPMFKLIFICNKLPEIKHSDKATWNRIRVIPFESTFVRPGEPCPDTYEEQMKQKRFPMDKFFSDKIPKIVNAFAWLLLKHHFDLKSGKAVRIEDPVKVRVATESYKKRNDIMGQFIEDIFVNDADGSVSLTEFYVSFKDWIRDSNPGAQLPTKNEVREGCIRKWGKPEPGNIWNGIKFATTEELLER
jgi:P4 family phage/plasmid primase-like protien